jgi:AcrR family transcriptional regulator
MGHREDLLAGAVRCLREKGYARTTARDIVAASGTNLASIGYHYGSTQALLNAAVFQVMEDFGAEIRQAMGADGGPGGPAPERFHRFWAHVIDSFRTNPEVWRATFDVFGAAQHDPQIRAGVAQGLEDGRSLWASALYGLEPDGDDHGVARAVGSLHQALLSGVLIQWLIDPDRAPAAADLAAALQAIARQLGTDQGEEAERSLPESETDTGLAGLGITPPSACTFPPVRT